MTFVYLYVLLVNMRGVGSYARRIHEYSKNQLTKNLVKFLTKVMVFKSGLTEFQHGKICFLFHIYYDVNLIDLCFF